MAPLKASVVAGADVLVVRELLGGIYFCEELGFEKDGSSAYNTMRYTADQVERIARVAFQEARNRRRKYRRAIAGLRCG